MLVRYLQKVSLISHCFTVFTLGISIIQSDAILAQPVPDINPDKTLGAESSRVDRVNATRDRITGGATRGANLFHSFEKFDVREGRAAYFANLDGIATIFSRVTGSDRSEIFGTLGVEGDTNLFFINPNGIIFGPNATLDVRGAFVASTANSIAFPNGENFNATNPDAPPLLTIDVPVPIGLRFEGSNNGIIVNQADLKSGGNFALIGAAIRSNGQITAPGGDITLATVPDAVSSVVRLEGTGEYIGRTSGIGQPNLRGRGIILTGGTIDASSNGTGGNVTFDSAGNVSLSNATFVDVRGTNGGSIAISGQNVNLAGGSQLLAGIEEGLGFRGANAGDVTLEVANNVVLRDTSGIENRVNQNAIGNAGDINIRTGSLGVFEGSTISATTFGRGNAGDITIVADESVVLDGLGSNVSAIATTVDETAVGNAGDINIKSQSFSQTGDTQIGTFVEGTSNGLSGGNGNAGDVTIQVEDDLTIAGFDGFFIPIVSFIFADLSPGARGNAGNINLKAGGAINLGESVRFFAGNGGIGNSGNINLQAESVSLIDGVQLVAGNDGGGNAGKIEIQAKETLNITGFDNFGRPSGLFSSISDGKFNAGNIDLQASSITLNNFAQLNTSNLGQGNAGKISIEAKDRVSISNNSLIASNMEGSDAIGNVGTIAIESGSVSLNNSSQLQASSRDGAQVTKAGVISINATESVSLVGNSEGNPTSILADVGAGGTGDGGGIFISAPLVSLSKRAALVGTNRGEGNAGNIDLQVGSLILSDRAQVLSENRGRGNAGNISIKASDRVFLENGSLISSNLNGAGVVGNAGKIAIEAGRVSLNSAEVQNSALSGARVRETGLISIKATDSVFLSGQRTSLTSVVERGSIGNSSNIFVSAPSVSLSKGARLNTSNATGGNGGNITVRAQDTLTVSGFDSSGDSSRIITQAGQGDAGTIDLQAGSIIISDRALLSASNTRRGSTGNILLRGKDKILVSNSRITTNLGSVDGSKVTGSIGTLSLEAGSVSITDNSLIQASIASNAQSREAEGLFIRTTDSVFLSDRSQLNTVNFGQGNAGNIKISARTIEAREGASIFSTLVGEGRGGDITISSTDTVSVDRTLIASEVAPNARGNGGQIKISARALALGNQSILSSMTRGQGNAGNITVKASDSISLDGASGLQASTFSSGRGGNIAIDAQNATVSLNGDSVVTSSVVGGAEGQAGNLNIQTRSLSLSNGSQLATSTLGKGKAGNINIAVNESFNLFESNKTTSPAGIFSTVQETGEADGGNIFVKAGSLSMVGAAQINASTSGKGNAGNIRVNADGAIALSGIRSQDSTKNPLITSRVGDTARGNGGRMSISANSISLKDGAQISASTFGRGNAGNINLNVDKFISLFDTSSQVANQNPLASGIFSTVQVTGKGNGGQISVNADSLSITDGALISNNTSGKGDAGTIQVNVRDNINLSGFAIYTVDGIPAIAFSGIYSDVSWNGKGNGGNISISADSLSLDNLAVINTSSLGRGNAGNILIQVNDSIRLTDLSIVASQVGQEAIGKGGDINIQSRSLNSANLMKVILENGARISVSSLGTGIGGQIEIEADKLTLNRALISARTASTQGGNIDLNLQDLLSLRNGSQISATAGIAQAEGDGGNININARTIFAVPQENSDITANAFRGNGGRVTIDTESIFGIDFRQRLTPLSDITASSERGAAGRVIINTSGVEPTRGLENLTEERINVEVAQGCQVGTAQGGRVSFYNIGRGGLPPSPEDFLDSPMQGEWLSLESEEDTSIKPQTQRNVFKTQANNSILTFSCSARAER